MSARKNPRGIPSMNRVLETDDMTTNAPIPQTGSRSRFTPRNSFVDEAIAVAAKETPHNTLRQLSTILPKPTTPLRPASSTGLLSTRRSSRRTPTTRNRTPGAISKTPSALQDYVPTTYARAAMKKVETNRTATLTPSKDRHMSGRQLRRDTPRDPLRALSRILAHNSKSIELSPQVDSGSVGKVPIQGQEDEDDRREPVPRLSIPLDGDDDDSLLLPTLTSGLLVEDDNLTQRSVELPRDVVGNNFGGRFSAGSFGSARISDQFADLNEFGLNVSGIDDVDSTFIQQGDFGRFDDGEQITQLSIVSGRTSDTRPDPLPDETEDTFVLAAPLRNSISGRPSVEGQVGSSEDDDSSEDIEDETVGVDYMDNSEVDRLDTTDDTGKQRHLLPSPRRLAKGQSQGHKVNKRVRLSKYDIQYPLLPAVFVRRIGTTLLRTNGNKSKLGKETLDAIIQASDWFFERLSDDLSTYSQHAGRKTIDEIDMIMLMKRQGQINAMITPFALAQRHLPRELLQELRVANYSKSRRSRRLDTVQEEDDD